MSDQKQTLAFYATNSQGHDIIKINNLFTNKFFFFIRFFKISHNLHILLYLTEIN
mgnify:CR=1 FL=1